MLKSVAEIFKSGVYISDGGWGSELIKRGLVLGDNAELWNITHHEQVLAVAKSYVDAGSDIILTNTFGGNSFIQEKHGQEKRIGELNKAAVLISKEAADGKALVFASIGPTGKMVSMGEISSLDAYQAFKEQADEIESAGADAIVIETMSDVEEFDAAMKAAKETGLPVVGCMSFDSGTEKERTMMGINVSDMIEVCKARGADAVGANCGVGIESYIAIAKNILSSTNLPVWIKANAGLPVIEHGKTVYKMGPEEFAGYAVELKNLGVRVIGGCCGTTPAHIAAVKKAFSNRK